VRLGNRAVCALIARKLDWQAVSTTLSSILSAHGASAWYSSNWGKDGAVRRIAQEVGGREDTTTDNVKSRLQSHPEIRPLLRPYRMQVELHEGVKEPGEKEDPALLELYDAYKRLLFYHASTAAEGIRVSGGLDPDFGGKKGGIADTRSLPNKRAQNVASSKGKAFVTRKYSEAKQYLGNNPGEVIRILIPVEQQKALQVDPDSVFGLYIESGKLKELLKGVDRQSRDLSWWAYSYLAAEVSLETKRRLPELYRQLMDMKLFPAGREEPTTDLTKIPQPRGDMTPEEADAMALRVFKERAAASL
jgi:hypothetical protein